MYNTHHETAALPVVSQSTNQQPTYLEAHSNLHLLCKAACQLSTSNFLTIHNCCRLLLHVRLSGPGFASLHMLVCSAAVTVKNILGLAWDVNTNTLSHEQSGAYMLKLKVQFKPVQVCLQTSFKDIHWQFQAKQTGWTWKAATINNTKNTVQIQTDNTICTKCNEMCRSSSCKASWHCRSVSTKVWHGIKCHCLMCQHAVFWKKPI